MHLQATLILWLYSVLLVGASIVRVDEAVQVDEAWLVDRLHSWNLTSHALAKRGGDYGDKVCAYHYNVPKLIMRADQHPYWMIAERWEERNSVCMGDIKPDTKLGIVCQKVFDLMNPLKEGHMRWLEHKCPPRSRCRSYPRPGEPENMPSDLAWKYAYCQYKKPPKYTLVLHPGAHYEYDLQCARPSDVSVGTYTPKPAQFSELVLMEAFTTTTPTSSTPLDVPELRIEVSTKGEKGPYNVVASSKWASTTAVAYFATVATIFVRFCVVAKPWQLTQYARIGLSYGATVASTVHRITYAPEQTDAKPASSEEKEAES